MSDLTKTQIEEIKKMLTQRERALRAEIKEERSHDHYNEIAGEAPDAGDESVADVLTDVDNAMVERDIEEIRDIEATYKRLQDGTFGECIDCTADIGYQRLLVYPTAKRCINCQSKHEKSFAQGNMPSL